MTAATLLALAGVGLAVGVLSGMLGIGGGVLIIPILTLAFGFSHRMAVGTSLGMLLPPIGLLAFLAYWRAGEVNIVAAATLAAAMLIGGGLGGVLANSGWLPEVALQRLFALFLIYYAANIVLKTDRGASAVFWSLAAAGAFGAAHLALRLTGRRWAKRFSLKWTYQKSLRRPRTLEYEI